MILDDKIIMYPPPPPYHQSPPSPSSSAHFPFSSSSRPHAILTSLPSHILLQIIHHTFPPLTSPSQLPVLPPFSQHQLDQYLYEDSKPSLQRKTLFWLSTSLRLVSRRLYTACMHVLRSTYLPSYNMLIRPPYTSDPFPLSLPMSSSATSPGPAQDPTSPLTPTSPHSQSPPTPRIGPPAYTRSTTSLASLAHQQQQQENLSPLLTIHRETPVLDRFITLKVRQDVFADDSELHIECEDAFRDLFDVAQPRARLEDLVRVEGVRQGVVSVPGVGGGVVRQGQGQEGRVYTSTGTGSHSSNSSLVSLSSPKTAYMVPQSQAQPSSSRTYTQPPPQPKPKRSLFGFIKNTTTTITTTTTTTTSSSPHPSQPHPPPQSKPHPQIHPIPFSALSISFSPRRVGLVLNRSRTIAEVPRLGVGRGKEPLEVLARGLVRELRGVLEG